VFLDLLAGRSAVINIYYVTCMLGPKTSTLTPGYGYGSGFQVSSFRSGFPAKIRARAAGQEVSGQGFSIF